MSVATLTFRSVIIERVAKHILDVLSFFVLTVHKSSKVKANNYVALLQGVLVETVMRVEVSVDIDGASLISL